MNDLNTVLQDLHTLTATELARVIREGVPVKDAETGEVHMAPAPAAYLAQAINLLRHNGITAALKPGNPLDKLASLPAFGDGDDNVLPFSSKGSR